MVLYRFHNTKENLYNYLINFEQILKQWFICRHFLVKLSSHQVFKSSDFFFFSSFWVRHLVKIHEPLPPPSPTKTIIIEFWLIMVIFLVWKVMGWLFRDLAGEWLHWTSEVITRCKGGHIGLQKEEERKGKNKRKKERKEERVKDREIG